MKATFLVLSGPSHNLHKKHLHIVCTDPDANGNVVIVGITSYSNPLCDQTCILQATDHSWLSRKSYVFYRNAQIIAAAKLSKGIQNNSILIGDDMNDQVFLRVRKGLCNSPQTKRNVKRYLGCL